MASIKNRLLTITGSNVSLLTALKRLAYYAWAIQLPNKIFRKLGLISAPKAVPIEQVHNNALLSNEVSNMLVKVSIIIPTKNKFALLKACVDSIISKSTFTNYEIIVVNNQSNEVELLEWFKETQKKYSNFKTVDAPFDFNFSRLINFGAQNATGEYLVLLNNDTEVITPNWIGNLWLCTQLPSAGVVGCKLLYSNNTIQHAGVQVWQNGTASHVYVGLPANANEVSQICNYAAVTAAAMMVSKKLFDTVGGFDEAFKVEFNDLDFCLKLSTRGYHTIYTPFSVLYHHESASRRHPFSDPVNHKRFIHEQQLFAQKWHHWLKQGVNKTP